MEELEKLEAKIRITFKKIENKETTPKKSKIGKMFTDLKKLDEPSYEKHLKEYKKIFSAL